MAARKRVETSEGSGFVQAISPEGARRQFKLAVTVMMAFALAALFAVKLGNVTPRYHELDPVRLTVEMPGTLTLRHAGTKKPDLNGI